MAEQERLSECLLHASAFLSLHVCLFTICVGHQGIIMAAWPAESNGPR